MTHVEAATSLTFVLNVQHKNYSDTSWSALGSFANITATGVATKDLSAIKEEVRFSYTFTGGVLGDFLHGLIGVPVWRP